MLFPKFIELLLDLVLRVEVVNLVFILEQVNAGLMRVLLGQNFGVLIGFAVRGELLNSRIVQVVIVGLLG